MTSNNDVVWGDIAVGMPVNIYTIMTLAINSLTYYFIIPFIIAFGKPSVKVSLLNFLG